MLMIKNHSHLTTHLEDIFRIFISVIDPVESNKGKGSQKVRSMFVEIYKTQKLVFDSIKKAKPNLIIASTTSITKHHIRLHVPTKPSHALYIDFKAKH